MTTEIQGFVASVRMALHDMENNMITIATVRNLREALEAFTSPGSLGYDGGGPSAAMPEDLPLPPTGVPHPY